MRLGVQALGSPSEVFDALWPTPSREATIVVHSRRRDIIIALRLPPCLALPEFGVVATPYRAGRTLSRFARVFEYRMQNKELRMQNKRSVRQRFAGRVVERQMLHPSFLILSSLFCIRHSMQSGPLVTSASHDGATAQRQTPFVDFCSSLA